MNFFKLYIGDYQRDTAHLSIAEHGAYLLMLQHYYATEKPLPSGKALHRMLRAQDKVEREAIDTVAMQFWRETDEGLVNDRGSVEIGKADRQREVNRTVGKKGGRPKRLETDSVIGNKTESVSKSEPIDNPPQTPDTRHQTNTGFKTHATGDPPLQSRVSKAGAVCLTLKSEGIADVNPGHPDLETLLAKGAEVQNFVSAARTAVAKRKGFAYVLGIVKGQMQDAAVLSATAMARPNVNGSSGSSARAARMAEANPSLVGRKNAIEIIDVEAADVTARRLG